MVNRIVLYVLLVFIFGCRENIEIKFNAKNWKSDYSGSDGVRQSMIKDLLNNELEVGMRIKNVFVLLGEENYQQNYEGLMILQYRVYTEIKDYIEESGTSLSLYFNKESVLTNIDYSPYGAR